MSRRNRQETAEPSVVARVDPLDYMPKVGQVRHLTLTLPNSHWSPYGSRKLDTTVTLSADEADTLAAALTAAASEIRSRS